MRLPPLPASVAWRHEGVRDGFEVVFVDRGGRGFRGTTTGVEDDRGWSLDYDLVLDADGTATRARVRRRGAEGEASVVLERDRDGWTVDGHRRDDLAGLLDVDLGGSLLTNAFPLRRLGLSPAPVSAPAVYVDTDLAVSRIEQTYAATARPGEVAYTSASFDFATTLRVDAAGLVLDYPPLGSRHS